MLDIIRSYALKLDIPQMTIVGGKKAPLTNKSGAKIDKQATLKAGRLRKFETSAGAVGKAQKTLRSATATKEQRDRAKATIKRAAEKMRSGGSGIPFEKLHPRYPKGSPGGKGGKFMPKGSAEYKATVANNLAVEVASGKATLSEARQAAKEAGITTPPKKPELGEELGAMFKEADRIGKKYQDEPEAAPAKKTKTKTKQPATDATSVTEAEAKPAELEAPAKKAKPSKAKEAAKTKPAKNDLEDPTSEAYKARTAKAVERMKELMNLAQKEPSNKDAYNKERLALYEKVQEWQAATSKKNAELKESDAWLTLEKPPISAKPKKERQSKKVEQKNKGGAKKASKKKIESYDDFKSTALEAYKRLSYESNISKLVPIYQIRRDIGDRVTRTQFNDWMLKMHRDGTLHLHDSGSLGATDDQNRDSIYSDLLKTYYFNAELFK